MMDETSTFKTLETCRKFVKTPTICIMTGLSIIGIISGTIMVNTIGSFHLFILSVAALIIAAIFMCTKMLISAVVATTVVLLKAIDPEGAAEVEGDERKNEAA